MLTFKIRWQYVNRPASARTEYVGANSYEAARTVINRATTRTDHVVIIKVQEIFGDEAAAVAHLVKGASSAGDAYQGIRDRYRRRRRG
jgi:hypothetical protein